ncbi:hypothetical protein M9H77_18040 [Catharanthus roseus]|uniref:Uncharacterized protein n=1 Tax=Catharanthus roseus TaxID=4058 RepID=A0ACC0B6D0_CATRO|nr:hypothetical protein M9H77_18040 [Catharanthus roseus]
MEISGEGCVLSYDTIDSENYVSLKSSGVDKGDLIVLESVTEEFYDDYGFKLGFSIHKGRKRCRTSSGISYMRRFNCHKEGKKFDKWKVEKCYSKVHIRIDCKAMIEFRLNNEGGWTVRRHDANHNNELCCANQRRLMHSQRVVIKNHARYFQELKDSGVSIAANLRCKFKEAYYRIKVPTKLC